MKFSGKITGVDKLLKSINKLSAATARASGDALTESILEVHGAAIKSIQAQGSTGHIETRYRPTRTVQASAPGQPPNSDTGRLVQSIQFEVDKMNGVARVGTNLKYGAWLEFGTSTTAARPWLRPAFLSQRRNIEELFGRKINIAIKDSAK